ncbi:Ribosomal RNA large subunit methyltransferase E [Buchnera aphidicola (Tetraneura ulmi)]|uniref:RlmE family RNA methyltransferase n=1 Tax=Buchnera aphidicola TaxID=9 RepID=UPI0034646ADC
MIVKKRSHSSKLWLSEHFKDEYVKKSHKKKLISRAWFKLQEIDNKEKLFKLGMNVLDLGSSPGSWSKYASEKVGKLGKVFSCDIIPMNFIPNVNFIQGDLRKASNFKKLLLLIKNTKINTVISDMSPNTSGCSLIDLPKIFHLGGISISISKVVLSNNGKLVLKTFQGTGFDKFLKKISALFLNVKIRKPNASRGRSREVFIVASKLKKK